MTQAIQKTAFIVIFLFSTLLAGHLFADDLDYIDKKFPYQQLTGSKRLKQAAKCTRQGDGRCFMLIVAEIIRNFRKYDEPNPVLRKFNLAYFVNAINQWEYKIKGKRDNYVYLSQAIYYGHKNAISRSDCNMDDFQGFNGPLSDLDSVKPSICKTSQCKADVKYYVEGFQNFYRNYCQR